MSGAGIGATAAKGHMPFAGHRTCAEWTRRGDGIFLLPRVQASGFASVEPRNTNASRPERPPPDGMTAFGMER